MKKITLISAMLLFAFISNAQFKIAPKLYPKAFKTDTVTVINIKLIYLNISLETNQQRPVFDVEFTSKTGVIIEKTNIGYDDVKQALIKKGNIPESDFERQIAQMFSAVLYGTKSERLFVIREIFSYYNIVVLPDNEQ